MTDTVALIGVGAMGKALLARLQLAGKRVQAFDVSDAGRTAAREGGATAMDSAAAAARGATHIHVFVRTDEQEIGAALGATGVLATAAPGTFLFLHSTVLPATTLRVGAAARAKHVRALDVPVTSVPARVQDGEAVFLVGGAADDVEATRSYLMVLGKSLHHFGPLGAGNVAKLAKNLANAAERVLMDEVLRVAESGGLDPRVFLDMMRSVDQGSLISRWERTFTIANGHATHRPASNLFNKDMKLAAAYAAAQGLEVPMTQSAAETGLRWSAQWERERASAG
jgi:3-hydroxyisobutyrate dehydrogenase-like beta-hydroxyacid dehydrogenase